jgi:putative tricarboxylic transport membrane protein
VHFFRLKISDTAMPTLHRYNILAGLLLAALGAFILQQSLRWEFLGRNGPGVGFFPLVYGSLIVVLSLVLVIKSLRAGRSAGNQAPEQPAGKVFAALSVWVAFAATVALMKFIGFYVALGLLVMFMTRFIFSRSLRFALLSGVLVPLTFFVVFGLLLKVQLPVGIWTGV